MIKDLHVKVVALLLTLSAGGLMYIKVTQLGLPLEPQKTRQAWTIDAEISFTAKGRSAKLAFYIPRQPPGFELLDENFVSSNYGLALDDDGLNRKANWAVRRVKGQQSLYYRMEVTPSKDFQYTRTAPPIRYPDIPDYDLMLKPAIMAVLEHARQSSADTFTFTRALLRHLNHQSDDANVALLKKQASTPVEWTRLLQNILAGARIPTRILYVLPLVDGSRHATLQPRLEVFNGNEWQAFNPSSDQPGLEANVLLWRTGDDPLVIVEGGSPAEVSFSMVKQSKSMVVLAEKHAAQFHSTLMEFSMFSMPVQTQSVFRVLLLLPLGALIVVVLRNLVGFSTFGIFMPILIALSFRESTFIQGVLLYALLIALGLGMRFYLEKLQLLLVPRIAAVLVIVLITMTMLSLLFHKLDIHQGLSLALFPIVIISMTIEHMSVVWEEHGPLEALLQLVGSFFAASLGYFFMQQELTIHLMFIFPELSLIILALILLIGRYRGYRLTELWRFREVIWNKQKP